MINFSVYFVFFCGSNNDRTIMPWLTDIKMHYFFTNVPGWDSQMIFQIDGEYNPNLTAIKQFWAIFSLIIFLNQFGIHNISLNRKDFLNQFDLIIFFKHRKPRKLIPPNLLSQYKDIPLCCTYQILLLILQWHKIPYIIRMQMIRYFSNINEFSSLFFF